MLWNPQDGLNVSVFEQLLKQAALGMNLSGRAYFRIIRLSRTIADLTGAEIIGMPHVAEALQYRKKD